MSSRDADVAVIGLGAVGSMAAWRLAARGLTVHGFERFGIAHDRGASAGQTRRFSVQSQREQRFTPLAIEARKLWLELGETTGQELLTTTGGVVIGPAETPSLQAAGESARRYDLPYEKLDADELTARFPQHRIRPGDAGVTDPLAGFLRPERSVATAVGEARRLGATVYDYTRVLGVSAVGDGVAVDTETGRRHYSYAVIAPGARARDVLPELRSTILPRRIIQGWYLPERIADYTADRMGVFERVGDIFAYGFPTLDGATIKIGIYGAGHPIIYDTENVPLTIGVDVLKYYREVISEYFPGLQPDPVATSVGIEGYTTDSNPVLGPVPESSRIVLACGFSGSGFKFAPVMGDIAADYVIDGAAKHPADFLRSDRQLPAWPAEHLTLT